jgi:hypothetical protein
MNHMMWGEPHFCEFELCTNGTRCLIIRPESVNNDAFVRSDRNDTSVSPAVGPGQTASTVGIGTFKGRQTMNCRGAKC